MQLSKQDKKEIVLYFCEDYYNYFYGVMPLSTGYIDIFDLERHKSGFIVRYPSRHNPNELGKFAESKKFLSTLKE